MLAAVTGFGGAAVLLPMLALVFGVRQAIPILTVAQLIGTQAGSSSTAMSWIGRSSHGSRWAAYPWHSLLFARAPLAALTRVLGGFLILIVIWRHTPHTAKWKPPLKSFAAIGAGSSFLSALLGSVGPLMAPFSWPTVL